MSKNEARRNGHTLQIYNTLTRTKNEFQPIEPENVQMYVCGPTVYDDCHLGHARTFVTFDMVARYLRSAEYSVTYARNITDIDDKIIARAAKNGERVGQLTQRFTQRMHEDCEALGVLRPDMEPKAHEHVRGMIVMIEQLIEKGFAYKSTSGGVYYDISRFAPYGALSGRKIDELRAQTRTDIAADKRSPLDFVLWKRAKPDEPSWRSPWGEGRPGWHIECSAMAMACLGQEFDIHGGGMDLKFPHHENEIAQSEAANDQRFGNVWMHTGFVLADGRKMAKSDENGVTVRTLLRHYPGESVRFFILSSHYRSPISYCDKGLRQADTALRRLYMALRGHDSADTTPDETWRRPFALAMNDDFNTPRAIGVMFDLAHALNSASRANTGSAINRTLAATLRTLAAPLGLLDADPEQWLQSTPAHDDLGSEEAQEIVTERIEARGRKDWAEADRLRNILTANGVSIEDGPQGTKWYRTR